MIQFEVQVEALSREMENLHTQFNLALTHIATEDSPESAIGVFLTDMENTVERPLQARLEEHKDVKAQVRNRDKLLLDFDSARQAHSALASSSKAAALKMESAEATLNATQTAYEECNAEVLQLLLEGTEKSCTLYYTSCSAFRRALSKFHTKVGHFF